jgi:phage anti-repressor protein
MSNELTASTDLIPVAARTVGSEPVQTVNARNLHAFLGVGAMFATWIKDRITKYEFAEGVDYLVTVSKTGIRSNVTTTDYFLTLDMAKEIAMVERNDAGKRARAYFIECERKLRAQPVLDLNNPAALRQALLSYSETVLALTAEKSALVDTVAKLEPKAIVHDIVMDNRGYLSLTEVARKLPGVNCMAIKRDLSGPQDVRVRPGRRVGTEQMPHLKVLLTPLLVVTLHSPFDQYDEVHNIRMASEENLRQFGQYSAPSGRVGSPQPS